MEIIRSKANPLIKQAKKLHQKKYRKQSYLIEGWHLLEEALASGQQPEHIFVRAEDAQRVAHLNPVHVISPELLEDLADSQTPQGVLAQLPIPVQSLPHSLKGRYLILEDVQDPGNVGTMIRTADAAGYDGVFLSDRSADIYSMKVLRAMQGSHFHLPIFRLPMEDIVSHCRKQHIPILASTLSENSCDYRQVASSKQLALVMGNEGQGISDYITQQADQLIHIPMPGQAESLNVAVAAGILLFSFI